MIYTYSTKESAIAAIPDFCSKKEQDVFVYHVKYPAGDEFSLRLRNEVMDEGSTKITYKYFHPITSHFANRDNAYRERLVWMRRLGHEVHIERHYCKQNGYDFLSHYTLNTEICST